MKTGFIGVGNMGGAILKSYASSPAGKKDRNLICDQNRQLAEKRQEQMPDLSMTDSIADLVGASEVIGLGVKPQGMEPVLEQVARKYRPGKLIISMAAGISIAYIRKFLGEDARIIRIMPNTPAMVGEAMIAICREEPVDDKDMELARRVLGPAGKNEEVDEKLIDCVIGVSGSSPAYTYMYIEGLVRAAEANGMDREKARVFAAQSVLGAAKMVLESPESLEQLRINVCSPGGTTIEAVQTLQKNGFMDDIAEGFQAAVDRSIEMTKEKQKHDH